MEICRSMDGNADQLKKSTPMHYASKDGDLHTIQLLWKKGAKISKMIIGNTPLHSACDHFFHRKWSRHQLSKQKEGETPLYLPSTFNQYCRLLTRRAKIRFHPFMHRLGLWNVVHGGHLEVEQSFIHLWTQCFYYRSAHIDYYFLILKG